MDNALDSFSLVYRSRVPRFLMIVLVYGLISTLSVWLAYQLRFDFFVSGEERELRFLVEIPYTLIWVVPVKLIALALFRQYSGLLGYFGTPDLYRLMKAVLVGSAVVGIIRLQVPAIAVPPRGVILMDFLLTIVMLGGFRTGCRMFREAVVKPRQEFSRSEAFRIAILGAGDVGASLAKELLNRRGLRRVPIAFLDDNPTKWNQRIHNVPVVGGLSRLEELKKKLRIEEVVIAMPNAPAKKIGEIVRHLQRLHIKFVTVPSVDQMATGKVRLSQFRDVEIQDLLGREPVSIERESIREMVTDSVILVTGAGGSIGSELCRQIITYNPARLLMLEQSEYLLFEIEQQLMEKGFSGIVLPLVANILDKQRIEQIFERYKPEIVFHAAALKHVPMMEVQPSEAVKVNVLGTAILADEALRRNVRRFVMISTDKAINPTSVMGASKRLAEMYVQSLSGDQSPDGTAFMAVRFGNVLGSSGSVIPTFKRQIANGGPVRVTHPDVTRYFMTIPEAVGLVLQCGCQGNGGEIFVLDMGKPVRIVDLARDLIELSGLRADEDIEIEYIGLRPGEKLFEELQHAGENTRETSHPKVMCFVGKPSDYGMLKKRLAEFQKLVYRVDGNQMKQKLKETVMEYEPYLEER